MSEARLQAARDLFRAYESGDRALAERHLHPGLTFFSPADPGIDRATYFERCWPNAGTIISYTFSRFVLLREEVLVTYEATRTDGTRFRNTELLTFDGDLVVRVEVYFGWELAA